MEANREEFLWVEKFRPHKIADCILPDTLTQIFLDFIKQDNVPNMILAGPAGTGKTTIAQALCEEIGVDYLKINGSEESGIDTLRTKIRDFASTVSFAGKVKVVILDEADYLNPNSTQPALRGFMEEFSKNCRFIFTCNYKNRIIPAIHSRAPVIEFTIEREDVPKISSRFFRRAKEILAAEGIACDDAALAGLIKKFFPDFRRVLGELQRYAATGSIDVGILTNISDERLKELVVAIREKDFKKANQWVIDNADNDSPTMLRKVYDVLSPLTKNKPELVLIIAESQFRAAFNTADHELNTMACLVNIMANCEVE